MHTAEPLSIFNRVAAPRVRSKILDSILDRFVFDPADLHRVQVHITREGKQILVAFHQLGFVVPVQQAAVTASDCLGPVRVRTG